MRYLASRDLLDPRPNERVLARLRSEVSKGGWAMRMLERQKTKTYWATKKTCYLPKFTATIWQLQVLADLGLSRRDERIANAVEMWFDLHTAKDRAFTPWSRREADVHARIHFRHRDRFMKYGHLCTTGNAARSLVRFGYLRDERVQAALDWLVDAQCGDGGWHCFGRPEGTIDSWEAMSAFAEIPNGPPIVRCQTGHRARRGVLSQAEARPRRRVLRAMVVAPVPVALLLRCPCGPRLHDGPRIREGSADARGAQPSRIEAFSRKGDGS